MRDACLSEVEGDVYLHQKHVGDFKALQHIVPDDISQPSRVNQAHAPYDADAMRLNLDWYARARAYI